LIIKIFLLNNSKKVEFIESYSEVEDLVYKLNARQNILERNCPSGASGKNGGNRIWKNWKNEKSENKSLLDFYKQLNNGSSIEPKTIFNLQKKISKTVLEIFQFRPFCINLESNIKSCNLINTEKSLNEIDIFSKEIIDNLNSIILFDCERKRLMTNFSFDEINKWNTDYNTTFTKYLIISFGKGYPSVNHTMNKLELIRDRFKTPNNTSFTITNSELDYLLKRKKNAPFSIEFVGYETSSFWDSFILEVSIRELYELRSIKLMNIYSICYNDDIKNYILNDLFSIQESSELISLGTKSAILELRDDDIEILRITLSQTLDMIIKSGIKTIVSNSLSNNIVLVFDETIIRNQNLLSKIRICFDLNFTTKYKTWPDLINSDLKDLLILSYRDQGRYPYSYFPNLLELDIDYEGAAKAILPNFFFINNYNWSKYKLHKNHFKLLTHSIRDRFFDWNNLLNKIQELKPKQNLNIDWNLETEYSNSDHRESYKLKLKGQKVRTFYSSDLFILKDEIKSEHKVVKIDYLLSFDYEDSKVYIQNLDEIQENINIYGNIVDKKQQAEELDIIRKQFNLEDETAGRLWKVLLKNLAEEQGEDELYSDLKKYFETKGIKIVSQFHFKNSWINPQSESIAPLSKRVFIELCEYLKIPKIYFIIIQRIRNASKQSSRQSTRKMNQLLKDLFNDGCFDANKNARGIIKNRLDYYKLSHPLDDLGIDENYLTDNLVTLVELIQPELEFLELENIEKNNNE
jgi:hypothetical protein